MVFFTCNIWLRYKHEIKRSADNYTGSNCIHNSGVASIRQCCRIARDDSGSSRRDGLLPFCTRNSIRQPSHLNRKRYIGIQSLEETRITLRPSFILNRVEFILEDFDFLCFLSATSFYAVLRKIPHQNGQRLKLNRLSTHPAATLHTRKHPVSDPFHAPATRAPS